MDNTGLLQRVAALETVIFGSPSTPPSNTPTAFSVAGSPLDAPPMSSSTRSFPTHRSPSHARKAVTVRLGMQPLPSLRQPPAHARGASTPPSSATAPASTRQKYPDSSRSKHSRPSAATPAITPQRSLLLELPPELREEIYRLAVTVPTGRVGVDAQGYQVPPLLRACREIRSEALTIFYSRSVHGFVARTRDFDSSVISTWYRSSGQLDTTGAIIRSTVVMGSPHWKNLLCWLKKFHACEFENMVGTSKSNTDSQYQRERGLVEMLFEMARRLRTSPWGMVESVLTQARLQLIESDARWGQDH